MMVAPRVDTPQPLGQRLFSMVVVADTHMNQSETECTSPFAVNLLANSRTRYVVNAINALEPELVVHLGDLIHPVPALPSYGQAAEQFLALVGSLAAPLHLVPGNHDVGDKPIAWGPAGTVRDEFLRKWERYFGRHYYAFDHRGCHFVVINAQIINSDLRAEAEQRDWLEHDLAAHAHERTFLCTHYPPYLSAPDESESYDNLAEPGRSWLLSLIERYRPEALFAGHVHNFWYNRYADTDCYVLPSTAFVRHDYSEFYRAEPGPEGGRNDTAKLGFFEVEVFEHGHVCHVVRTFGRTLEIGEAVPAPSPRYPPVHTRTRRHRSIGLDLRQPWAEVLEIAPSGALDEFERKRVRNDYPLMALWEMGIADLRVPIQDLAEPAVRARMALLSRRGHRFTVYSYRVPEGERRELLIAHRDLLHAWEVVTDWESRDETLAQVASVKREAPIPTRLSKLRSKDDMERDGSRYYHTINHGFTSSERDQLDELFSGGGAREAVDGAVLRCARERCPVDTIRAASRLARALDATIAVHVRLAGASPADAFVDEEINATRALEAAFAAAGAPEVEVFLDTFADADRGYFMRTGLVDRRYNPRRGWYLLRHLHGALDTMEAPLVLGPSANLDPITLHTLSAPGVLLALVLSPSHTGSDDLPAGLPGLESLEALGGEEGRLTGVDLSSGVISHGGWRRRARGDAEMSGVTLAPRASLLRFEL